MTNLEIMYVLSMLGIVFILLLNNRKSKQELAVSESNTSYKPYVPRHLQKRVKTLTQSDIVNRRF